MIGRIGRLPDGIARYLEADRDFGKFRSDRLVLDDDPPALDTQSCILERCLVGGTADTQVERLLLRTAAFNHPLHRVAARSPSALRRLSAGTRQSLKTNSPPTPWQRSVAWFCSRTVSPGASYGTRSVLMSCLPDRSRSVVTWTTINLATGALSTQSLKPLTTQSPLSARTAFVVMRLSVEAQK